MVTNVYVKELGYIYKNTRGPFQMCVRRGVEYKCFRDEMVKRYAWAIPNDNALETIAKFQPIVEMGAGSGYWAYLLQHRGVVIEAFDGFTSGFGYKQEETWTHVDRGGPPVLAEYGPEWNLFISWPPYDSQFGYDCLRHFNGKYVLYIGEGPGGCNGDDAFHVKLAKDYALIGNVEIPNWDGIYDELFVFRRRKVPLTDNDAGVETNFRGDPAVWFYNRNPDMHQRNLALGRMTL